MLDIIQALAAPIGATIAAIGAYVVSKRAIGLFAAQKALERRIAWYDAMAPALRLVSANAGIVQDDSTRSDHAIDAFMLEISKLLPMLQRYASHVGPVGYEQCVKLADALTELPSTARAHEHPEQLAKFRSTCGEAAEELEFEMRTMLGLNTMFAPAPRLHLRLWNGAKRRLPFLRTKGE